MVVDLTGAQLIAFVAFVILIAPAIFYVGRVARRIDSLEVTLGKNETLAPRLLVVEKSVEILKEGQQDVIVELKGMRTSLDRLIGRLDAGGPDGNH